MYRNVGVRSRHPNSFGAECFFFGAHLGIARAVIESESQRRYRSFLGDG